MQRSPTGLLITECEAGELLCGAMLLEPEHKLDDVIYDQIEAEIDARFESPGRETEPIELTTEQVSALYGTAQKVASMGLYVAVGRLRKQQRILVAGLGTTWRDYHELKCREEAENYIVAARHFVRLVESESVD